MLCDVVLGMFSQVLCTRDHRFATCLQLLTMVYSVAHDTNVVRCGSGNVQSSIVYQTPSVRNLSTTFDNGIFRGTWYKCFAIWFLGCSVKTVVADSLASNHHKASTANTVRCRYNAVNFLKNPHNRHPIARPWGEVWGVCCEFEVWFTFCCCNRNADGKMVINWNALNRHSPVFWITLVGINNVSLS